jgi:uncharacterized protein YodC (DUF2158 family)
MRYGEMVRIDGSGPLMKIVGERSGEARCVYFDQTGAIHSRYVNFDRLTPFWLSTGPKSLWPDITQIDMIEIEREERDARLARKAAKKLSRKSRRSNRIRSARHAAA